jgi:hypothetical protein
MIREGDLEVALTPLALRIAPALVDLALSRTICWSEAELVLDAVETYDRRREDLAELVGIHRFEFYRKLGGRTLTLGVFRAKVRHELETGEHL